MSRYIVKNMYLEKPKQLIIWNGGSLSYVYLCSMFINKKFKRQKTHCINNFRENWLYNSLS